MALLSVGDSYTYSFYHNHVVNTTRYMPLRKPRQRPTKCIAARLPGTKRIASALRIHKIPVAIWVSRKGIPARCALAKASTPLPTYVAIPRLDQPYFHLQFVFLLPYTGRPG